MRSIGFAGPGSPLNDQSIFVAIIVRNPSGHLKPHVRIEGLSSLIASSHLCPHLLKRGSLHRPLKELSPDAFSSMMRMDSDRKDVPVLGENDGDSLQPDARAAAIPVGPAPRVEGVLASVA